MHIRSQLLKLYLFQLITAFRVTDAIWVFLLIQRGFSLAQVGIAEGVFHLVSFLCEVPSGMFADLLGRKRTLVCSGIMIAAGCAFMLGIDNFTGVLLSMIVNALSYNLMSGTEQALTYDSLLMVNQADRYISVSSRQNVIYRVIFAISGLSSMWAVTVGWQACYLLSAALGVASSIVASVMTEPLVTEVQKNRSHEPLSQLPHRLAVHFKQSFSFLWKNPRATCIMLSTAGVSTANYITLMLLQDYLPAIGLPAGAIGIPLLLIDLIGSAGVALAPRAARKHSCFVLAMICAVCAGGGTLCAAVGLIPLSIAGTAFAALFDGMLDTVSETALNDTFPSDQRATLVSVVSMLYSLLMIAASPLSGAVSTAAGTPAAAIGLMGALLLVCAPFCGMLYRKRAKKSTVK